MRLSPPPDTFGRSHASGHRLHHRQAARARDETLTEKRKRSRFRAGDAIGNALRDMTAPTSNVIPFVPRRKRPRVCIAIRSVFNLGPVASFIALPANDYHAIRVEDGGAR